LATLTVSNLLNTGAGSLRNQIAAANSGDTIVFQTGLSGSIDLRSPGSGNPSELLINKDLTITGNTNASGAPTITVDGFTNGREFDITSGTVSISNLIITDGFVTPFSPNGGEGGGILVLDANSVTLTNCSITNNLALTQQFSIGGGGIGVFSASASLTMINCTVSGNSIQASDPQSGSEARGGGIEFNSTGSLTMTGVTVTGNAISAEADGTGASSNQADARGGGISFLGGAATNTLTNCTITGNSATATIAAGEIPEPP
jgi:hypothetical protein